ncbi:MAG: Gfo/Idh/MocA family protein [Geminicoccaceae bacterium]
MNPVLSMLGRRLRLAVIGGGPGSFIGPVHRTAARLDDRFEIVAAVLSSDAGRSRAAAGELGIAAERAYADWAALLDGERALPDGADAVAVMTPNGSHHAICAAALEHGFHLICDKPLTTTLPDAVDLVRRVRASGRVFCLTHNYTAYPMVRQARDMVRAGAIGEVRQIHTCYVQGHNATLVEGEGAAGWRFDPAQCGPSLILGDIGTHAHHLAAFVSGQELREVMAEVWASVPGRRSDDAASVLMRWSGGARGSMWVTNAAAGGEHGLGIRIFGAEGGLEWWQEQPNELRHRRRGGFEEILTRRLHGALTPSAERAARIEIGHPEGYQEAFADLYKDAAEVIAARIAGRPCDPLALDFPTAEDGARGIAMIEACLASARSGGWAPVPAIG